MKKRKIIYIISGIDKALAFEWIAAGLNKEKFDLQFILIGNPETQLAIFLKTQGIKYYEVGYQKKKHLIKAWCKILTILWRQKPAVVHTHLWVANVLGLSTSWTLRIAKRIYTRHHAVMHYREYPSGRKWDKLMNVLATDIIAISANVEKILIEWDKADPKKVHLIHHGFDFTYLQQANEKKENELRQKYQLESLGPVVGVISRYTEWKGIQFIIPAFAKLRNEFPSAHLILANTKGDYAETIRAMLAGLPSESFTEIEFEKDLAALYGLFDIFIHTPVDAYAEAFGQIYVESLICGVPAIFTMSGVAPEFIGHLKNALVVPHRDSTSIYEGIVTLLTDVALKERLIEEGKKSVDPFQIDRYIHKLENLYAI